MAQISSLRAIDCRCEDWVTAPPWWRQSKPAMQARVNSSTKTVQALPEKGQDTFICAGSSLDGYSTMPDVASTHAK